MPLLQVFRDAPDIQCFLKDSDKLPMKKSIFLILAFVLTATQLPAQVKTGGGGGPDPETNDVAFKKYEEEMKIKGILADLTKETVRIEKECNGRKTVPEKYTFVDSYYALSLKKGNEVTCAPKVAKCLKSKQLRSIMDELNHVNGKVLYDHLKKEYKLEEDEAQIMLNFFTPSKK